MDAVTKYLKRKNSFIENNIDESGLFMTEKNYLYIYMDRSND